MSVKVGSVPFGNPTLHLNFFNPKHVIRKPKRAIRKPKPYLRQIARKLFVEQK